MKGVLWIIGLTVVVAGGYVAGIRLGLYGEHEGPGTVTHAAIPEDVVASREHARAGASRAVGAAEPKQILFGDLHVHTTFSTDAFFWSLPILQGEGPHPLADACDYARFCSSLDFWSINDHAEALTPRKWRETKETIRQCNAVTGDRERPDVTAFLGWEWTQVGRTPDDHYGHKNVILRNLDDDRVPARPIGAAGVATEGLRRSTVPMPVALPLLDWQNRQRYYNLQRFREEVREVPLCPEDTPSPDMPRECYESAATPGGLFRKLDEWGFESMVIPHGTTWGFYTPPGTSWDKQLTASQHDPRQQFLIEVMSGHGNSEEYRDWRAVRFDENGEPVCPEPTEAYHPSCWRAGEIIRTRCMEAGVGADECSERAAEARRLYLEAGVAGHLTVPGEDAADWLDAGQCRDCFLPAFNYRPANSVQYILAITNPDAEGPDRFRFGLIASSDNHRARPGTGYKEVDRLVTTESAGFRSEFWRDNGTRDPEPPEPRSRPLRDDENVTEMGFEFMEYERQSSFFTTGGLAAVHADGRSRDAIWEALERKETYGTSGDRILLWFDLLNAGNGKVPMGGHATMDGTPRFQVRAVGAFEQKPGCPDSSLHALGAERIGSLCKNECYNPSDERKLITRIEVVRIRPQSTRNENVAELIEDPWRVFPCEPDPAGCRVEFEDPGFVAGGRDTLYYVRAIEEPSPTINADPLRCTYDDEGNCVEVDPCWGDFQTPASDDCLGEIEERAWSSPIFVDRS